MAGSNNIPKYAQVNREDELSPLKFRGITFSNPDAISFFADPFSNFLNVTPQQTFENLEITGPAGAFQPEFGINYASVAAILGRNFYMVGMEAEMTISNLSARTLKINFPDFPSPSIAISPGFNPTVLPNEVRTLRIRILSPTKIYVY